MVLREFFWTGKFAALLGIFLVTAPAFASEAPTVDAEWKAVALEYRECQVQKARILDDGISDALTIGQIIASACRPEMEQVAAAMSRGEKNRRVLPMVIERLASHAAEDAARMVLLERKKKSDGGIDLASSENTGEGVWPESAKSTEASGADARRRTMATGGDLADACGKAMDPDQDKCIAFIRGVIGAYRAGIVDAGGNHTFCLPDRYFAFMWKSDLETFVANNPVLATSPAEDVVIAAMTSLYPCEK
jgi:hypothetical protein